MQSAVLTSDAWLAMQHLLKMSALCPGTAARHELCNLSGSTVIPYTALAWVAEAHAPVQEDTAPVARTQQAPRPFSTLPSSDPTLPTSSPTRPSVPQAQPYHPTNLPDVPTSIPQGPSVPNRDPPHSPTYLHRRAQDFQTPRAGSPEGPTQSTAFVAGPFGLNTRKRRLVRQADMPQQVSACMLH